MFEYKNTSTLSGMLRLDYLFISNRRLAGRLFFTLSRALFPFLSFPTFFLSTVARS